jgi:hypothetical protein
MQQAKRGSMKQLDEPQNPDGPGTTNIDHKLHHRCHDSAFSSFFSFSLAGASPSLAGLVADFSVVASSFAGSASLVGVNADLPLSPLFNVWYYRNLP